jgi:hypothetical protein
MWLSQQAFEPLERTEHTRWSADALTAFTNLPVQAIEQIHEASKDREPYLTAEPNVVDFDIAVNGRKAQLQAIRASTATPSLQTRAWAWLAAETAAWLDLNLLHPTPVLRDKLPIA